ncbi:glutathione peroxidase [Salipaludibacillus neizhouensis]|uniref:Glutathione peroxidase n=1 Tax=Salipaludibacillus neizhouensis TaxID=885475 RepID=A0A3A9KCP6_9BACI|nr:glutathione peroxidase [Salipaludibacillus neizhouensis]RKL67393.1 glutathione peroxidase [Salipaludibacillus neizhouensis]
MSIYDITVTKSNGESYSLNEYKGKTMLIVNTASKCGLKDQFDDLEELYKSYKDQGFIVLGFPSDQFGQEVNNSEEAEQSCRMSYGVTFPMHNLIQVNGKDAEPLFRYLTENSKGFFGKNIKWNFTKFLVDKEGSLIKRYAPKDKPKSFENDIINVL